MNLENSIKIITLIFLVNGYPDEYEAVIDVAIQLGEQWSIIRECGSNFYFGFGPKSIMELRRICTEIGILKVIVNYSIDQWLKEKFNLHNPEIKINFTPTELNKISENGKNLEE